MDFRRWLSRMRICSVPDRAINPIGRGGFIRDGSRTILPIHYRTVGFVRDG